MTSIINNSAYYDKYQYSKPGGKTLESSQNQDDSRHKNVDKASVSKKDQVTLSRAATEARTRETMGLSPTGRLQKKDIEDAARSQHESVEKAIASHLESLGFNPDLNISLTLDKENNIIINEKFAGRVDLEELLNNDSEFLYNFKRLSANNEILDYTTGLQIKQTTLAELLNPSGSDENALMSMALRYEELKGSVNPLETLLGFSKQDTPYTYVHNPENDTTKD